MTSAERQTQTRYKRQGAKGFNVVKMDDEIYKLRRNVINVIYEIKDMFPSIPRQVVRIVERDMTEDTHDGWHLACGYAGLGANYIHITKKWSQIDRYIYELVAHELVHSIVAFGHDDKCPLMSPCLGAKPMSKADVNKRLEYYLSKYK
jgi:hypothetical protein